MKVRLYQRGGKHYVLQWWDPQAGKTLYDRINGDLIDAIARARKIDQRIQDCRTGGVGRPRLSHEEVVKAYVEDLVRRADAGQIAPGSVGRFSSALAHYTAFTATPEIEGSHPRASRVDREFALKFAAHLSNLQISPNGCAGAAKRRMRGQGFVLDAVRAMFQWAADPQRGNLMPEGFRNPFLRAVLRRTKPTRELVGEPDITVGMAAEFLAACDAYQLRLFAPMVLYGLRAAEPIYLFHEMRQGEFLRVGCIDELDYTTKGRRSKLLPQIEPLETMLFGNDSAAPSGLLYPRRDTSAVSTKLVGSSMDELVREYHRRCAAAVSPGKIARMRIRQELLFEAGSLTPKLIQREFNGIARSLGWPKVATPKDLRHLFHVAVANAGMPEHERQYLMGHAVGHGSIVNYTHLNKLAEHFCSAVEAELGIVLATVRARFKAP